MARDVFWKIFILYSYDVVSLDSRPGKNDWNLPNEPAALKSDETKKKVVVAP